MEKVIVNGVAGSAREVYAQMAGKGAPVVVINEGKLRVISRHDPVIVFDSTVDQWALTIPGTNPFVGDLDKVVDECFLYLFERDEPRLLEIWIKLDGKQVQVSDKAPEGDVTGWKHLREVLN